VVVFSSVQSVVMEGPKFHDSAKRVAAHSLISGKYRVVEDVLLMTPYGPQRSVAIQPLLPQVIVSFIPKAVKVPEGSLVGQIVEKKDIESTYHHPSHGITYSVEFLGQEQNY
jgi:hypothetical protein